MFPTWDYTLLEWINSHNSPVLDEIMIFFSEKLVWIPLYLFIIYQILKSNPRENWKIIIYLLLIILFADQTCSSLLKPWIARLRPCHEDAFRSWIHLPNGCGGMFGFCSSHAANSFGLAIGIHFIFRNKKATIPLLIWAFIISYSRIYLGAHYPVDVIVGAGIGTAIASLLNVIYLAKIRKN